MMGMEWNWRWGFATKTAAFLYGVAVGALAATGFWWWL